MASNLARSFNSNTREDSAWKAQAFLNSFLPRKDGSRAKLGAIALRTSVKTDAAFIEWMDQDPTKNLAKLNTGFIQYEYVRVRDGDVASDLAFD